MFSGEIQILESVNVHKYCLLQNLSFSVCALILCTIPGCQRKGRVYVHTHCGQKGSDGLASSAAVRKPGGYIAGQRAPHRAVLPVEWMDVLRPR